jgi:indole-3-glycerol phosphate synthase
MDFLTEIVEHKRREVAKHRAEHPLRLDDRPARRVRDFRAALAKPRMSVIAEFKRRSPSRGLLRQDADIQAISSSFRDYGAAALSVLTDEEFFGGSEHDLRLARQSVPLPVLRKDFIVDEHQVYESARFGADALLLIVRILSDEELRVLLDLTRRCGLFALVETHNENEIARAVACGARIIGANSRNLDTFDVNLDTALHLRAGIPRECVAVAESGIRTRADVERLEAVGYDAVLIGEALMCAPDPGRKLAELLGRSS